MADEIKKMIKNDPFVYNLFANDTKYSFNSGRPINWIKIPTSFLSENGKDSSISLMSVYTYTGDECTQIKNSITDSSDIVFSNDGHVAVNFKQNKTEAQFFYPNPMVTQNTGGSTGGRPIGIANTVAMKNTNFNSSFIHDDKILFSQNLLWILYQLPGFYYSMGSDGRWKFTQIRTGKNTTPVYVLLYNTIHRKNFQDIYAKIINLTRDPFSTQDFIETHANYINTIKKYCNAFRVQKFDSPNTGSELYHYADPACALAIDTQIAKLSQTLSLNLTAETWQKNFYSGGKAGFEAAIQDLVAVPPSDAYCSRGSGGGPSRFLREKAKVMEANGETDSFMQILANYKIVFSGEESSATSPPNWNSRRPGDSTKGAVCGPKPVSFVDCSVTISTRGDINFNKNNVRPACGNQAGATAKGKTLYNLTSGTSSDTSSGTSSDTSSGTSSDTSSGTSSDTSSGTSSGTSTNVSYPVVLPSQQGSDIYIYIYIIIISIIISLIIGLYFIF